MSIYQRILQLSGTPISPVQSGAAAPAAPASMLIDTEQIPTLKQLPVSGKPAYGLAEVDIGKLALPPPSFPSDDSSDDLLAASLPTDSADGELPSVPSSSSAHIDIPEFNNILQQLLDALDIDKETQGKLKDKLKDFDNINKYKFIHQINEHLKKLIDIDKKIVTYKKKLKDVENFDKLNGNLAELQFLSIIQKNKIVAQEIKKLLIDKFKAVIQNLNEGMAGGSSKDIHMSKYLKYKNKYLSLKNK